MSETELECIFDEKWMEWMQDFTVRLPEVYQHNVNIATSVEICLRDLLQKHDHQIIEKLRNRPLQMWGKPLRLVVQSDTHLLSCRWYNFQTVGIKGITFEDIEYAQWKTDSFLQVANQYLRDLKRRQIQNFSNGFIYGLFNKVFETVDQFNQEKKNNFKFTPVYNVDIALTVGGYALCQFEQMLEQIKKENDLIEHLKIMKVPLFKTFKSQYSQVEIAADKNF